MFPSDAVQDVPRPVYVGCAGWSLRSEHAALFPEGRSHLERYARRFGCVEINSCFYRSHRPATYSRWASVVPETFRFACKLPREISHRRRLVDPVEPLDQFLGEIAALGERMGPILVQLPPSLAYDGNAAEAFFSALRDRFSGGVVCEPRHASWFTGEAERVLSGFQVARVAADPAINDVVSRPGGWDGLVYYRLHGSPRVYYSAYSDARLSTIARHLQDATAPTWCIFDNTAIGAATTDALAVVDLLGSRVTGRPAPAAVRVDF